MRQTLPPDRADELEAPDGESALGLDDTPAPSSDDEQARHAHERPAYARAAAPGPAHPDRPAPERSTARTWRRPPTWQPCCPASANGHGDEHPLTRWLLEGQPQQMNAPYEYEETAQHHPHPWWKVMCLTGVDYFSTLGYQPGIAALAAGALSPIATLILVLLTLFGALPIYRRVAEESPHGEGSIAMLERLLTWWKGKLFVLVPARLRGDRLHHHHHPLGRRRHGARPGEPVRRRRSCRASGSPITLVLIALLGAVFLKGFKEAIGIAVVLVGVYLVLNVVVIGVSAAADRRSTRRVVADWQHALFTQHGNPLMMVAIALLLLPEAGARAVRASRPAWRSCRWSRAIPSDTDERPAGRIRNTRKLLTTAAVIMSVFLIASSFVTTLLIPPAEFAAGRQGQRPRAGLPGARVSRRAVRHGLRRQHDPDPLVRRRLRDGRAAEHRAALPAALRHGAGLGARRRGRWCWSSRRSPSRSRSSSAPTSTRRAAPTPRACWC